MSDRLILPSNSSRLSSPRRTSRSSTSSLQSPPHEGRQVLKAMTNQEISNVRKSDSFKNGVFSPPKPTVLEIGKPIEQTNNDECMTENSNRTTILSMSDELSKFRERFGDILQRNPVVSLERLQIDPASVVCLTSNIPSLLPCHFLRCHSAADAPPLCDLKAASTDTNTAITCCRLEPDGLEAAAGEVDLRVGCCGGRVVSVIHVATGTLVRRFTDPLVEQRFTALAWSRLVSGARRMTILAVAGRGGTIALFHPDFLTRYCRFDVVSREDQLRRRGKLSRLLNVRDLQFDPERPCWLYCAVDYCGGYGEVCVWHVGRPGPPPDGYSQAKPRILLIVDTGDRLPLCLAVSDQCLAVGTDCELFLWRLGRDEAEDQPILDMTGGFDTSDDEGAVHAVSFLPGGSRLAVHFSRLNRILVWRVAQLFDPDLDDPFSANPLYLPQGDSDGWELCLTSGLSCCGVVGEDVCWLLCGVAGGSVAVFRVGADRARIQQLLEWPGGEEDDEPSLYDGHLSRADKLLLRAEGVGVLSTTASATCRHVVVTTDVNMVCIWSMDESPHSQTLDS